MAAAAAAGEASNRQTAQPCTWRACGSIWLAVSIGMPYWCASANHLTRNHNYTFLATSMSKSGAAGYPLAVRFAYIIEAGLKLYAAWHPASRADLIVFNLCVHCLRACLEEMEVPRLQ